MKSGPKPLFWRRVSKMLLLNRDGLKTREIGARLGLDYRATYDRLRPYIAAGLVRRAGDGAWRHEFFA